MYMYVCLYIFGFADSLSSFLSHSVYMNMNVLWDQEKEGKKICVIFCLKIAQSVVVKKLRLFQWKYIYRFLCCFFLLLVGKNSPSSYIDLKLQALVLMLIGEEIAIYT